jgi:hypothetical protein
MLPVVHHYGSMKPPPIPATPQPPGQTSLCFAGLPSLLLATALQFHEGWME